VYVDIVNKVRALPDDVRSSVGTTFGSIADYGDRPIVDGDLMGCCLTTGEVYDQLFAAQRKLPGIKALTMTFSSRMGGTVSAGESIPITMKWINTHIFRPLGGKFELIGTTDIETRGRLNFTKQINIDVKSIGSILDYRFFNYASKSTPMITGFIVYR
jgi:hypothetical protein